MSKRIRPLSRFRWRQDFYTVKIGFPENQVFQSFCSILMVEKLVLRVYNNKSNVFQVLEGNYIDYSCLY